MDAPRARIDFERQRIRVGGFQLGKRTVVEDELRQLVSIGGEFGKHRFLRGALALLRLLQHGQPSSS